MSDWPLSDYWRGEGSTCGRKDCQDLKLTCKARAVDVLYAMVGYEELLLPAHEDCVDWCVSGKERALELVLDVSEGGEAAPVDHVFLVLCAPFAREESVAGSDDLGIEVGR